MADEVGRQYFQSSSYHPLGAEPSPEEFSHGFFEEQQGNDLADVVRHGNVEKTVSSAMAGASSPPRPKKEGRRVSIQAIPRVAIGSRMSPMGSVTPGSSNPMLSPSLPTAYDSGAYDTAEQDDTTRYRRRSSPLGTYRGGYDDSDTAPLTKNIAPSIRSMRSTRSKYDSELPENRWYPGSHR